MNVGFDEATMIWQLFGNCPRYWILSLMTCLSPSVSCQGGRKYSIRSSREKEVHRSHQMVLANLNGFEEFGIWFLPVIWSSTLEMMISRGCYVLPAKEIFQQWFRFSNVFGMREREREREREKFDEVRKRMNKKIYLHKL